MVGMVGLISGCGGGGSSSSSTPTPTPVAMPDGAALYSTSCAGCHGALATSTKAGVTLARLQSAVAANTGGMGSLSTLTSDQLQAIVTALAPATTPPTPTVDGAVLYSASCAGCHGALATSTKTGVTLTRLQSAIAANTGGMGALSTLSSTQIQAIVTALTPATTTPIPTPTPVTDGATLYATNCAGCHNALASSAKAGATATRIQTAINNNTSGMGSLSFLTPTQVSAIATTLAGVVTTPTPTPACGSCHAIPPATGRHSKHNSQNISCATCHGSGYSTTTVNATTHNNGTKNVASTIGWNATTRTCANSCHGNHSW
jgi:mono/diheme cytochrome c family protein